LGGGDMLSRNRPPDRSLSRVSRASALTTPTRPREEPVMSSSSLTPDDRPPDAPATPPSPAPSEPGAVGPRSPRVSTRRILMAAVPLVAVVAIVGGLVYLRATQVKATSLSAGLIANAQKRLTRGLDASFTDADKDLVADVPADPARLVDPETIVFSYI